MLSKTHLERLREFVENGNNVLLDLTQMGNRHFLLDLIKIGLARGSRKKIEALKPEVPAGFAIVPKDRIIYGCRADRDGDCSWVNCPQHKFHQSGCPLYNWSQEEE